jgi:hypothetical protein
MNTNRKANPVIKIVPFSKLYSTYNPILGKQQLAKMAEAPVKYTLTHYRKPQHDHESFINWIVKEHLPLALPVLKKHGVLEYSLVSVIPDREKKPKFLSIIISTKSNTFHPPTSLSRRRRSTTPSKPRSARSGPAGTSPTTTA